MDPALFPLFQLSYCAISSGGCRAVLSPGYWQPAKDPGHVLAFPDRGQLILGRALSGTKCRRETEDKYQLCGTGQLTVLLRSAVCSFAGQMPLRFLPGQTPRTPQLLNTRSLACLNGQNSKIPFPSMFGMLLHPSGPCGCSHWEKPSASPNLLNSFPSS